jgi:hypothetical protein
MPVRFQSYGPGYGSGAGYGPGQDVVHGEVLQGEVVPEEPEPGSGDDEAGRTS